MANQISHRYNRLPLLPSGPGGVRQELVVPICRFKVKENLIQYKEQGIKAELFVEYYRTCCGISLWLNDHRVLCRMNKIFLNS